MRFSTKAEYGLRAAVNLARQYPERKSLPDIAEEEGISLKYLERLMGELRKGGVVEAQKGKSGGYVLARKPKEIPVGEIVEILEGPLVSKCDHSHCRMSARCSSSLVWGELSLQIRKTLFGIKLSRLI